jgi:manganese efflux pump family protein
MTTGTAALMTWLLTAGIGVYMLRTWIARGGLRRQRATGVGVPPGIVFGHASAALTGLAAWVGFLAGGWDALAWVGVVLICSAVTLGVCTVTLWTPYPVKSEPASEEGAAFAAAGEPDWPHWGPSRAGQPDIRPGPAAAEEVQASPAEHPDAFTVTDEMIARLLAEPPPVTPRRGPHLLPLIPACHGLAAMSTLLLALLAALGAR